MGRYAYVADSAYDKNSVRIIDVSDPSAPYEVGYFDFPNWVSGVSVAGGFAYVPSQDAGLRIVDVTDPKQPLEVGFFDVPAYDVVVENEFAYIATGYSLEIINVADPSVPVEVGSYDTPGSHTRGVDVREGYAYLVDEFTGLFILGIGPRSEVVDFTVATVDPVQVVYDADINEPPDGVVDLVLGKPMAARVRIDASGDLSAHLEKTVTVTLDVVGHPPVPREISVADLVDGSEVVYLVAEPSEEGFQQILVTLVSTIVNEDPRGNSRSKLVKVRETAGLRLAYLLVRFPLPLHSPQSPLKYNETVEYAESFLVATYPLQPDKVSRRVRNLPVDIPGEALIPSPISLLRLYPHLWLNGKLINPRVQRVIAVVPDGFFAYYGMGNMVSGTLGENATVVILEDGHWVMEAHEIGHTFGLWVPPPPSPLNEEYSRFLYGREADGYWVKAPAGQNSIRQGTLCFMGSDPGPETFQSRWIDKPDYEQLFRRLRTDTSDPEILLVSGTISREGQIDFSKLYMALEGTPDATSGSYTLQLLDINGALTGNVEFEVGWQFLGAEQMLDVGVFAFAVEFPDSTVYLRVVHEDAILAEVNVLGRLLHDAVAGIPDHGFEKNSAERRSALHNKINAVDSQISIGDVAGAIRKLQNDVIPTLERWLVDDYAPDNVLQYSISGILDLASEIAARLAGE